MIDRNRQELDDSLLARAVQDMDEDDCKLEERASEEGAERVKDIDERRYSTHLSPTYTHAPGVSKPPGMSSVRTQLYSALHLSSFAPLQRRLPLLCRRTYQSQRKYIFSFTWRRG